MQMVFSRLVRMPTLSGQAKLVYLTVQIGMLQQKHQFVIELLLESIQLIKLPAEKTIALDFVKGIIVKQLRRLRSGLPVIYGLSILKIPEFSPNISKFYIDKTDLSATATGLRIHASISTSQKEAMVSLILILQ